MFARLSLAYLDIIERVLKHVAHMGWLAPEADVCEEHCMHRTEQGERGWLLCTGPPQLCILQRPVRIILIGLLFLGIPTDRCPDQPRLKSDFTLGGLNTTPVNKNPEWSAVFFHCRSKIIQTQRQKYPFTPKERSFWRLAWRTFGWMWESKLQCTDCQLSRTILVSPVLSIPHFS